MQWEKEKVYEKLKNVEKRRLAVDGIGCMQSEDRRQETVDISQPTMYTKQRTADSKE